MWKRMRWLKGYRQQTVQIDSKAGATLLHDLCPDYVGPCQPELNPNSGSILDSNISVAELEHCIKSKDTAPGVDGISFSMIKNIPDIGKSLLAQLFNRFLSVGFVPVQWRAVKLIAIPKANSTSSNPAVRPIALMSCPCKIFHSIIKNRIEWFLEQKGIFSQYTVGFRKSRSCIDSLAQLVSNIQLSFAKNEVTLACFIDIDNAYNNVDVPNLVRTLDRLGISRNICNFSRNF